MKELLLEIQWGFQRMFRGYDDTAHWHLDTYLTNIALPVLIEMHQNVDGYPYNLNSLKEWKRILAKMIVAFQLMKAYDDMEIDFQFYSKKTTQKKIIEGVELFGKHYRGLWT